MKRLLAFFYYPAGFTTLDDRSGFVRFPQSKQQTTAHFHCLGLLVNWRALWIGAHYSQYHKRLCVNLLPGVTLWWAKPGGQLP